MCVNAAMIGVMKHTSPSRPSSVASPSAPSTKLFAAILTSGLFFSVGTAAQMTEILLPAPAPKAASIVFRNMKDYESKAQWLECAQGGRSGFAQSGIVKGWVLRTWVRCALASDRQRKRNEELGPALRAWQQHTHLRHGPWADDLMSEIVKARLWAAEFNLKTNTGVAREHLQAVFDEVDEIDKGSLARAFALTAEMAHNRRDFSAAAAAYEQALSFRDDAVVQEKYNAVLLALSQSAPPKKQVSNGGGNPMKSDIEQRFDERFNASGRDPELTTVVEDCAAYLKALPNGLRSKWAAGRMLEIHQFVWDRMLEPSPDEKWKNFYRRVQSAFDSIDQQRLLDWLPIIFRRGDYESTQKIAEKLKSELASSASGSTVLWFAARSHQLSGNTKKAEQFFHQYLEKHAGGDMARDALFQLALTHLRNRDFSSATAVLERLLQTNGADRFELSARYWLVRSLQAQQNPRSVEESRMLIEKFPLTYYGIRLRSELQNGTFEWPFASKSLAAFKGKIFLSPTQKKAWDRMRWLSANGWESEAMIESQSLPIPGDPVAKVLTARELATVESFPRVIRILQDVSDLAPDLRSAEILQLGMPKTYHDLIAKEAKKRSLNPILLRSLIRQESAFHPRAVSSSNALGLMQIIPPTAREVAQELKLGTLEIPDDLFGPNLNVQLGAAYLAKMLKQFDGSVPFSLAAYNAGPRRMQLFMRGRPSLFSVEARMSSEPMHEIWVDELPWAETSFYVKAILRNAFLYQTLDEQRITLQGVLWKTLLAVPES